MPDTVPMREETDADDVAAADRGKSADLLPCLAELTRRHGRPQSPEALTAGQPAAPHDPITPALLMTIAERAGFRAAVAERSVERISSLTLPAILPLQEARAALLLDIKDGWARLWNPASRAEETIPVTDLAAKALGFVLLIRPEPTESEQTEASEDEPKAWFWNVLKRHWWVYGQVLLATVLINIFALASPLFVMNVYDRVLPNDALETGWVLGIGALTVFGFDLLIKSLRTYFIDTAGRRSDVALASRIYDQVLDIRLANRPRSTGAFASVLRDFESVRDFFTSATLTALVDAPFALLFLLVIALIGGPVAWVVAGAMVAILIVGLVVQPMVMRIVRRSMQSQEQRHGLLIESLSSLETVKTLGAQGRLRQRYQELTGKLARWGQQSRFLGAFALHCASFATQVSSVLVVLTGMYLIRDGALSIGGLIACVIITGRAMAPMAQLVQLINRYHYASSALNNLDSIMRMPVDRPPGRDFLHRPQLRGSVALVDVDFAYPGAPSGEPALRDVSLSIDAGEKVAILGRIGSGKSTLLKLMLGLYDPDRGSVRIDNTELRQIDPADLRRAIAFVGQDSVLLRGSLRENLTLARPDADDAAVLRAATATMVDSFASRHPMGYDLPIGEGGEGISGGQRQAIALARGLIQDAPMLIADEPTNAMDATTEKAVVDQIKPLIAKKTLVLVTHRTALLPLVDRIIVLDQGRTVVDGPRDKVIEALQSGQVKSGL